MASTSPPLSSSESATHPPLANDRINPNNFSLSLGTLPKPQFNFNLPLGQRSVPVSNNTNSSTSHNTLFSNVNPSASAGTATNSMSSIGARSAQIIDEAHNPPRTPGGSLVIGSEIFGFGKSNGSISARDRWSNVGDGSNLGDGSPRVPTPRAIGVLSDSNSYISSSAPWPHEFEQALNSNFSNSDALGEPDKFELLSGERVNQNTTEFNRYPTHPSMRSYNSSIENRSITLSQVDEVASRGVTPTGSATPTARPMLGRSKSHIIGAESTNTQLKFGMGAEDDSKLSYGVHYGADTFPSTHNYSTHQQQQQHVGDPSFAPVATLNSFQHQQQPHQRSMPVPERSQSYQHRPSHIAQYQQQYDDSASNQQLLSSISNELTLGIQNMSMSSEQLLYPSQQDYYSTQSNFSNTNSRNNSNNSTIDSFNDYSANPNSMNNVGNPANYYRRGSAGSINPLDLRSRDSGYAASPPHFNQSQNSNTNVNSNVNMNSVGHWQDLGAGGGRGSHSHSNNAFSTPMNSMSFSGMGTGNLEDDLSFLTGPASLLINSNGNSAGAGMTQQQQLLLIRQNQRNLNLNQNQFHYSDYSVPPTNSMHNHYRGNGSNSGNNGTTFPGGNNFDGDNNSSRNHNHHFNSGYGGALHHGNMNATGDDSSRVIRSPLLEEFRTNRHRSWELFDLTNHIVEFSGDQLGSRHIQQKLDTASHDERQLVFEEILPNMLLLSTDVFANYVIQKLFEQGTQIQKTGMATLLEGHVLALSLQMYGCRVVQKALEFVLVDQQVRLIRELDGHVLKCARDAQSNHVVQRALERVPSDQLIFITDACIGQVQALATHPYGCRVLQRIFENCPSSQTRVLLDDLHRYTQNLIQDQYGNYVIQWIVEKGDRADRSLVISKVCGQLLALAQQKFASNVIEKCIIYAEDNDRRRLVEEVLRPMEDGNSVVRLMLSHPYANYVFQKILVTTTGPLKDALIAQTTTQLAQLRKFSTSYSKHLITIEKLLMSERSRGNM